MVVKDKEGKEYECNERYAGLVYFCEDNIVVRNGVVTQYPKDRYLLVDSFLIDKKTGKVVDLSLEFEEEVNAQGYAYLRDSLPEVLNASENKIKINVPTEFSEDELGEIIITDKDGNESILYFDNHNRIVGYTNDHIEVLPDNFCARRKYIKNVSLKSVKSMGSLCFCSCVNLRYVSADNLEVMGNNCFQDMDDLEVVNMDNLKSMGDGCFSLVGSIDKVSMKSLETMGKDCFKTVSSWLEFNCPNLEKMGRSDLEVKHSEMIF